MEKTYHYTVIAPTGITYKGIETGIKSEILNGLKRDFGSLSKIKLVLNKDS